MSQPANSDLITVNIDGRDIQVPKGINIIEAAKTIGAEIPHYCYHEKLAVVGNCRMCLVEMGMPMADRQTREPILDENGKQKIGWMPRPAIACATNAAPGMHIRTQSKMVKECREGVMEFLLINHPLDCPICDQAGECSLQEFATDYGRGYSRFVEKKNVKPKRTVLGPRVTLDDERCILCSRCIRFSRDVAKDDVLGFVDRGSYSTLTCYPGKKLENNYSLNTVDICPVGALTSTDFRFKMRVWFLKKVNSIDTETSVGCNTEVWSREGKIYRITPRQNDAVNDTWMPDSGRVLYKQVEAEDRIKASRVGGQDADAQRALAEATQLLQSGPAAVVGSGRCSVEEQFLLKRISSALNNAPANLVSRTGEGDGLLVSTDRNPNVRGALLTGLISTLPDAKLSTLAADIDSGKIKTVLAMNEDLTAAGLTADQLSKVKIVYVGTHENATSKAAAVVLAGLTVFEKSGTFVNQQFRIQKFSKVVPSIEGGSDDLVILAGLLANLTGGSVASTVDGVWSLIAGDIQPLAELSYANIPDTGTVVDGSAFSDLPFVEGETLHFKPAGAAAATV